MEDNALITSALRLLFEETGHRVTIAATVAEAIASGLAEPVDLMLLDLTLPDGDGLSALVALREAERAPRVAVALTGHDNPQVRRRCLDAGCREVLLKPVPTRELLAKVRGWGEEMRNAKCE